MEFNINPNDIVKCHSQIRLRVSKGRNHVNVNNYTHKILSTLQRSIEDTDELFGNIFSDGGEIEAFYLLLRFLLPQSVVLEVFEIEKEIDLYVGSSYETANVITLSAPEKVLKTLRRLVEY